MTLIQINIQSLGGYVLLCISYVVSWHTFIVHLYVFSFRYSCLPTAQSDSKVMEEWVSSWMFHVLVVLVKARSYLVFVGWVSVLCVCVDCRSMCLYMYFISWNLCTSQVDPEHISGGSSAHLSWIQCTSQLDPVHTSGGFSAYLRWIQCTPQVDPVHISVGSSAHLRWIQCTSQVEPVHTSVGSSAHLRWIQCTPQVDPVHTLVGSNAHLRWIQSHLRWIQWTSQLDPVHTSGGSSAHLRWI